MQMEFAQRASNGTVSNLNAEIVKSVNVPVPSLEKQIQIAKILNSFESLINDHLDGLPGEIAARRRQYEYYRNKLLTFKELDLA
jgi:type I restriction enzyme S subunit